MLIFVHAEGHGRGLAAPHGILKAGELEMAMAAQDAQAELTRRAETMLQQAQEQAREVLEQAEAKVQRLRREAQQEIEAERARGYREGMRKSVMEWHDKQARDAIERSQSLGTLHGKLAEIVTSAVERIVNTESRAALYQRALKNVRSLTKGATTLTLRVSPVDFDQASETLALLGDTHDAGLQVNVVADPTLKAGSCIFESELGMLDASLETQLDGLRTAMARAVRAAVASSDAEPQVNESGRHVSEELEHLQQQQAEEHTDSAQDADEGHEDHDDEYGEEEHRDPDHEDGGDGATEHGEDGYDELEHDEE
ncbi:type III secretion system stator protein SctL [Aquincola sp. S2]|uniref:Type 3 secretion system stator protein n=1 Tax=Pseudaquabacterium terrae TaxID=2732868 RepID=A0ABX2EVD5_9BURK|nr:type III secretion system stator protein SctL [Aquabacterium terrae]NRF72445.1 type III secretion system stator protein SctL [Aquabacterium terrae]